MPAEIQVASGSCRRTTEATSASRANASRASPSSGATPITPRSRSPSASRIRSARAGTSAASQPERPLALRRVEADLHEAVEVPTALLRAAAQPADQLGAGRRSAPRRRTPRPPPPCCSAAPPMKCQRSVEVGALGGLLHRLLVPVLPHVADAEVGEQPDVGGREELGDHDERDLVAAAAGCGARRVDPLAHRGQPGLELGASARRRSCPHPDHAGQATGSRPVAAVGVEVGGLQRAARRRRATSRRRARAGRARRRRCRGPACPRTSSTARPARWPATSCWSASGTS